jgi:hypothetical protein
MAISVVFSGASTLLPKTMRAKIAARHNSPRALICYRAFSFMIPLDFKLVQNVRKINKLRKEEQKAK